MMSLSCVWWKPGEQTFGSQLMFKNLIKFGGGAKNDCKTESKAVSLVILLRLVMKVPVSFGFVSLQNSLDSSVDL